MKVNADQFEVFLQRQQEIPRVFLITGDEPLQVMESCDVIRQYAQSQGFSERDVLHADNKFDWSTLLGASNSMSLFSEKKLIDLRIETKTPGRVGSQAIRDYMQNPPDDKVLLIQMPKLVGSARNAAWVKAIEKAGVVVQIWDLSPPQTMAWVAKRMRAEGMRPSNEAVRLLTERVEGNLLAATQEISKLKLLFANDATEVTIEDKQVLESVSDSSRFSIFDLSNAVMMGDVHRVQHIHHNLKEEGVPVQLMLWTLSDLGRQLYNASFSLENGVAASQILSKMPRPRQKPFQVAMQRMQYANWPDILKKNGEIDRLSKGQGDIANKGMARVWSDLLELALILAGKSAIIE
ncbi:MAG: DNA polymerase III subunit delta [Cocleimonas sp.]|nr:DNA polymerase III subunit delta [Cocleimonas sp.]